MDRARPDHSHVQKGRKVFDDDSSLQLQIPSSWKQSKKHRQTNTVSSQTSGSLYERHETEVQSGRFTRVVHVQVEPEDDGATLNDVLVRRRPEMSAQQWQLEIESGFVTADCEVVTDPATPLQKECFVEFVEQSSHCAVQTEHILQMRMDTSSRLDSFLRKALPKVEACLRANENSSAGHLMEFIGRHADDDDSQSFDYAMQISVDLEKRKVLYPDWTHADHLSGVVIASHVTRSQERVYDIEYDDGSIIHAVKEEHVRLLDDPASASAAAGRTKVKRATTSHTAPGAGACVTGQALIHRLKEGIRVHAKIVTKAGTMKFIPGRVVKVKRNVYDVECEGGRVESNVGVNDLCIGLSEGMRVEARRPKKSLLSAMSISWNSTGNLVAVAFGRQDISGWCDLPGAVCVWNMQSTNSNNNNPEPSNVLDHSNCLMTCAFHPTVPSIIAAGSFSGEVVIWDLTQDSALYTSPIAEYTHREPVVSLHWLLQTQSSPQALASWLLVSLSGDGRMLLWHVQNKLLHPIRGLTLSRNVNALFRTANDNKRTSTSKSSSSSAGGSRQFPLNHGATTAAVSLHASVSARPTWLVVGQEGGALLRLQLARLLNSSNTLTGEYLRTLPAQDEVFPSLAQTLGGLGEGSFQHPQPHIGAVTCLDWSPFHRNLYLSCGSDGVIKLFHALMPQPLLRLEPAATHTNQLPSAADGGGAGSAAAAAAAGAGRGRGGGGGGEGLGMVSVTAVRFSPSRPCVFAAATSDGRIFVFDLLPHADFFSSSSSSSSSASSSSAASYAARSIQPVHVLYVTSNMHVAVADDAQTGKKHHHIQHQENTAVQVTDLSFNSRRKDLLVASDWLGRLHVWKLPSGLTARRNEEVGLWESLGRVRSSDGVESGGGEGGEGGSGERGAEAMETRGEEKS